MPELISDAISVKGQVVFFVFACHFEGLDVY